MKLRRIPRRMVAIIVMYVMALLACCALQLWKLAGLIGIVALVAALAREVIEHFAGGRRPKKLDEPEGMTSMLNAGSFPGHLLNIETLVKQRGGGGRPLWVLSDCCDYGSVSNPEVSQEIIRELAHAASEGMDVRVLVCGTPACFSRVNRLGELGFQKLMRTKEFKHFLKFHGLSASNLKSEQDVLTLLENVQNSAREYLTDNGVKVGVLPNEHPGQFLWINGNEVIAIYSDAGSKAQAGVWRDRKMVACFKATFEGYWEKLAFESRRSGTASKVWTILRGPWRKGIGVAPNARTRTKSEYLSYPPVN